MKLDANGPMAAMNMAVYKWVKRRYRGVGYGTTRSGEMFLRMRQSSSNLPLAFNVTPDGITHMAQSGDHWVREVAVPLADPHFFEKLTAFLYEHKAMRRK